MDKFTDVNFLVRIIMGLKSALLDASSEIQQLRNSCLSLYVKFTKEQVKSMELRVTCNKIKVKFEKELKESQLELNELKNELASKENDNINLNFKVKELKAHVEEKTRLIESYNIKDKGEKQNITHARIELAHVLNDFNKNVDVSPRKIETDVKLINSDFSKNDFNKNVDVSPRKIETDVKLINSDFSKNNFNKNVDVSPRKIETDVELINSDFSKNDFNKNVDVSPRKIETDVKLINSDFSKNDFNKNVDVSPRKIETDVELINSDFSKNDFNKNVDVSPRKIETDVELINSDFSENDFNKNVYVSPRKIETDVKLINSDFSKNDFNKNVDVSPRKIETDVELINSDFSENDFNKNVYVSPRKIETDVKLINSDFSENLVINFNSIPLDTTTKNFINERKIQKELVETSSNLMKCNTSINQFHESVVWDVLEEMENLKTLVSQIENFRQFSEENNCLEDAKNDETISRCASNNLKRSKNSNLVGKMHTHLKMKKSLNDIDRISTLGKHKSNVNILDIIPAKISKSNLKNDADIYFSELNNMKQKLNTMDNKDIQDSLIKNNVTTETVNEIDDNDDIGSSVEDDITENTLNVINDEKINDSLITNDVADDITLETKKLENDNTTVFNIKNWMTTECQISLKEKDHMFTDVLRILEEIDSLRIKISDGQTKFSKLLQEEKYSLFTENVNDDDYHPVFKTENEINFENKEETEFIVLVKILSEKELESVNDKQKEKDINFNNFCNQDQLDYNFLNNVELKTMKIESDYLNDFTCNMSVKRTECDVMINNLNNVDDEDEEDENDNLVIVEDEENDKCNEINKESCALSNCSTAVDTNSFSQYNYKDKNCVVINDKERDKIPRYNLRNNEVRHEYCDAVVSNNYVQNSYPDCKTSSYKFENVIQNENIPSDSNEIIRKEKAEIKRLIPRFYVENRNVENKTSQITFLTPLDEIWNAIKDINFEPTDFYTNDVDLIQCPKSIIHVIFHYTSNKIESKSIERSGKPVLLEKIKKIIKVFIEKCDQNKKIAFHKCVSSIVNSDRKVISWAMVAIILDSVTDDVRKQKKTINELARLSLKIEKSIMQGYLDILETTISFQIHSKIWKINKNVNGCVISCIILLSRFYTILCKMKNDADNVLNFVYQSLLSLKYRSHPVAFAVMTEWPEAFNMISDKNSLLMQIILFTLVHHKMIYNADLYRTNEVRKSISMFYQIKLGEKTAEEYAKEIMIKLDNKSWVDAIVLLCKRQMFPWAYINVVMKYILPILNKWKMENFNEIIVLKNLLALKEIVASCPISNDQNNIYNLDSIIHAVSDILLNEKSSRKLKESAVLALCELSFLRFSLCADILFSWRPSDGLVTSNVIEKLQSRLIKSRNISDWLCYVFPEEYVKQFKPTLKKLFKPTREKLYIDAKSDDNICVGIPQSLRNLENTKMPRKKKTNKRKNKKRRNN